MKKITRQLLLFTSTWLPLLLLAQPYEKVSLEKLDPDQLLFRHAKALRFTHPDSSIQVFEKCYQNLINKGDTLNAIYVLSEQTRVFGHQASYKESYDRLWKALSLADKAGLDETKLFIYIRIGRYFSFYKRKEKALEYFDRSLAIRKDLINKGVLDKASLADGYYAYCATYRELDEFDMGRKYLDSCFLYHEKGKSKIGRSYLEFEEAFMQKERGQSEEAIKGFQRVISWMEANDPGYQVLVYTYMGDAYKDQDNFSISENCYKSALSISSEFHSHIDFTPLIYKKLSELYHETGELESAYASLSIMNELDEKFFDSRSKNNRPLLEIMDAFRKEKEIQEKQLQEQTLEKLKNEEKVLFLQRSILIVCLIFISVIGLFYFNYVRSKYRAEKRLIRKKQELEMQKATEIIELKNRELSATALKLIQKDEFINTLKEKIVGKNEEGGLKEIKRILNTFSVGNEQNWKEFEARFIDVNKNFYKNLKSTFPALTQGDLKLCALIKLNFSSKDMAKLMGISVESVHTTRYRLRKKLGLKREDNLTEFIADF